MSTQKLILKQVRFERCNLKRKQEQVQVLAMTTRRQNKKHGDEMMMSFVDDCDVSIDIEL